VSDSPETFELHCPSNAGIRSSAAPASEWGASRKNSSAPSSSSVASNQTLFPSLREVAVEAQVLRATGLANRDGVGQGGYMHGVYNDIGPLWNPQSLGHNYLPQEPIAPYLIPGKSGGLYAPCSTLFIGNLGPTTSEKELTDLFKRYGGLQKLKIHNKEGALVCFAEFQNVQFSTYAMNALQGYTLESSDRAMRIEFAKTRMGDSKRALEGEQHHQKFNSSSQ